MTAENGTEPPGLIDGTLLAESREAGPDGGAEVVYAAGGIVTRLEGGRPRYLLIHRPKYDDWTFPKGKLDPGESAAEAALREVEEETGLTTSLAEELVGTRYRVTTGATKVVRYWHLVDGRGRFTPNREVDEVRWVTVSEAMHLISHRLERSLFAASSHLWPRPGRISIIRHANAEPPDRWEGDGRLRPLDREGRAQAAEIAERMADDPIDRLISSPTLRCRQTVELLAEVRGLSVEDSPRLAVGADPEAAMALLEELGGSNVVLCSHGEVIPSILEEVARRGALMEDDLVWQKGSTWVVDTADGEPLRASYVAPPAP